MQQTKPDTWPIIFEQVYVRIKAKADARLAGQLEDPVAPTALPTRELPTRLRGIHVIVLVHGFQGSSFDMRLLKNNMSLLHPEAMFLCSNANQGKTEEDIFEMGARLANEVNEYVEEWCPGSTLGKLSFIGHSLGGLIIRAGLPYLKSFQDKMETFVTFSTPHMGYMYASNTIVDAGLWVLKRLRQSTALEQLTMSDATDIHGTFLYQLSNYPGLAWFKNVLLVSSYQDRYVPVESARIELTQKAKDDDKYVVLLHRVGRERRI
jgi:triacylglycerol esterase/lipase EstA (alpha/beta hydrolase family)